MEKFNWHPYDTSHTSAWDSTRLTIRGGGGNNNVQQPVVANGTDIIELIVKLQPWHVIQTQAGIVANGTIDVLNVHCEGCHFNLIPSLFLLSSSSSSHDDTITARQYYYKKIMRTINWGNLPKVDCKVLHEAT
jgi:hypothetical protein